LFLIFKAVLFTKAGLSSLQVALLVVLLVVEDLAVLQASFATRLLTMKLPLAAQLHLIAVDQLRAVELVRIQVGHCGKDSMVMISAARLAWSAYTTIAIV